VSEPEGSSWGDAVSHSMLSNAAFLFVLWAMLCLNALWLLVAGHGHTARLLKSGRYITVLGIDVTQQRLQGVQCGYSWGSRSVRGL
jgi:hypothetical protein